MAELASEFEQHRRYLWSIAYRMLGSASDAEDIVQEAYLRARNVPADDVGAARAYLSTIITRLCLDHWKSARVRREEYVGPWLPEPIATHEQAEHVDVSSISLAFMVLLESLSPLERAAYLLREVFDYEFGELAPILGRNEAACRQLVHRAKAHLTAERPRFAPDREAHARLLLQFGAACARGDLGALEELLTEDVRATSDGGGKVHAATRPLVGRTQVAKLYLAIFKAGSKVEHSMAMETINGLPCLVARIGDQVRAVIDIETDGVRIASIRAVVNPDKLRFS